MTKRHLRHTMNHRDLVDLVRSSHRRCSVKKGILKISQMSLEKKCVGVSYRSATLLKRDSKHWCFPVKFAKFLRTSIIKNICERLILFNSPQNTMANSSGEFELVSFIKQNNFIQSNAAISFISSKKLFL